MRAAEPHLCLLGIGENGNLAFNDPGVPDFRDPLDAKIVQLDRTCREQQVAER
jgi:glucosamine-6-phosphate deaminase